jgi:acetylornithine deacetylase/succinyl-diaminopimelate desuccinylase-like protein
MVVVKQEAAMSLLDTVTLWIEKNRSRWLGDLKNWLSIPSISAQPEHAKDVVAAAEWASDYLRTMGMKIEIVQTAKHPCLLATTPEGMAPANSPEILIYGHYDVQPPEPLELWTTPPFEPTVRGGALFARGASDDKGQVHCHLAALMAWKEINGGFPCRISLLLEGEEEIGSPNLMTVVNARREQLKGAKVLLISDTNIFADGVPSITYGLRGLTGVEFALHGAKTDLHSGMYGGTVANPAHALCEMVAKLHDAQGRVTVPGFYDGVLPLTEAERAMWRTLPHDDGKYAAELGVKELFGEAGYSTLERKWARPTLEVNGLTSGYQGPGGKTVLPNRASVKITCRLVPNQDAEKVGDALVKYLEAIVPAGVRFELIARSTGSPPAITPIDSPAMAAAGEAMEMAFGKKPVFQREGGSIPVVAWFKEALGVDTVLMGFGLPDDRIHAPDEKLDLRYYYGGIKACAAAYEKIAERMK